MFYINGTAVYRSLPNNTWYYFAYSFVPSSTTVTFGFQSSTANTVYFSKLYLGLRELEQGSYDDDIVNVGSNIDFGLKLQKKFFDTSGTFGPTFVNAKAGDITSVIFVMGGTSQTLTLSLPTVKKRSDMPLTVISGQRAVYTFIYDGTDYYAACVPGMT